ncbi:MAG: glycosyltransferase [Candidatus Gracilibacteria bacterium]
MKKTLIIHDTFLYRGGGERLIIMMANALKADIASGFFSTGSYDLRKQGFTGKMISLMSPGFLHDFSWLPTRIAFVLKNGLRHFGLKWAFSRNAKKLKKDYDIIIMSGDCLSAVKHFKRKKIIYYCHTIPRYLFDQKETYEKKVPKSMLFAYQRMTKRFRKAYLKDLKKIHTLVTNSKNTQKRIKVFTKRDAQILYPPVDTTFFTPLLSDEGRVTSDEKNRQQKTLNSELSTRNYFLSFARLSSIKRVDRIVTAFQKMPEEKLILTYGKNDPEKEKIFTMIEGYKNISAICSPDDEELRKLIQEATATIYVPVDEDFGMSPVESMACGTPVIGVNDGGLKETILDGETGILIHPECKPSDIVKAVKKIQTLGDLSDNCQKRAEEFGLKHFEEELRKICS